MLPLGSDMPTTSHLVQSHLVCTFIIICQRDVGRFWSAATCLWAILTLLLVYVFTSRQSLTLNAICGRRKLLINRHPSMSYSWRTPVSKWLELNLMAYSCNSSIKVLFCKIDYRAKRLNRVSLYGVWSIMPATLRNKTKHNRAGMLRIGKCPCPETDE